VLFLAWQVSQDDSYTMSCDVAQQLQFGENIYKEATINWLFVALQELVYLAKAAL